MALKNMSLLSGATVTASGGTALAFVDTGVTIPNGLALVVPTDTNYALRRSVTARTRAPQLDKLGVWGKDKKYMSFTVPKQLASGKIVPNVIRVERDIHPETTAAEANELLLVAAQLCIDLDTANFWGVGSLS